MDVFFIKYRKLVFSASVFMFLYFFYELYNGVEIVLSGKKGEGIGTLVNASITLFVAIYFFINVRKANRIIKEEKAAAEANSNNTPEAQQVS